MIDYHIQMTARCDQCGKIIAKAVLLKPSAIDPTRWQWKREWKKRGVLKRDRRFGQELIYCQPCADGALMVRAPQDAPSLSSPQKK